MQLSSASSGWEMVSGFSADQRIPAATVLFRQGDRPQSAALLKSGWVKLVRLERDGQARIIALCPPGSLAGAPELMAQEPHSATAISLTGCELYSIQTDDFLNRVKTDPQFSWHIHCAQSRQSYAREVFSAQLKSISPRQRLEQLFWRLLWLQNRNNATEIGKEEGIKLLAPVQNQELAQMISVTPEHFSRLLKEIERDGLIHRHLGWRIFHDPDRLWRAPEIESLIKSNRGQPDRFCIADLILA